MKSILFNVILCLSFYAIPANGQILQWAVNAADAQKSSAVICTDPAGNVYIGSSFEGTADFDPGPGTTSLTAVDPDIFVQKFDASGNFIWVKHFTGTDTQEIYAIDADNAGNVFIGGQFRGTVDFDPGVGVNNVTAVAFDPDVFIVKLDGSGNLGWAKFLQGTGFDRLYDLDVSATGNCYATGHFMQTVDFDPGAAVFNLSSDQGSYDMYLLKLDNSGNFVWANRTGDSNHDLGRVLTLDASENIIVAGDYTGTVDFDPGAGTFNITSAGQTDIFIQKVTSAGVFVWTKSIGGTTVEHCYGITADATGALYMTGQFYGTLDMDPGAAVYNVIAVSGNENAFNLKLDASGNFAWANSLGTASGTMVGWSVAVDNTGVYFTGSFPDGPLDFNPGTGTHLLTAAGFDIYYQKFSLSGSFLDAFNPTPGNDDFNGYIVSDGTNILSTGFIDGMVDCDPGPGVTNVYPLNGYGNYIFKMNWLVTGLEQFPEENNSFTLSPNPATNFITISFPNQKTGTARIYNSLGKLVDQFETIGETKYDVSGFANGLYTVVYSDEHSNATEKLVVVEDED